MAQLDMERSKIIAPFNGFVENLLVATGDQVKENQVLLSFYPVEQLEVRAKIPAAFRYELQHALYQGKELTAITVIDGRPVQLKLDRLAGSADATGIDALFSFSGGRDLIRLGSMLSLSLNRPVTKQVIAVPFSAVYDNDRIYLLKNERLEGIKVNQLGRHSDKSGQYSQLISSPRIQAGDRIVITHLPNAMTGLRVVETDFKAVAE